MLLRKVCFLVILTLSITSCTTTQQTSNSTSSHFPIRIVSGSVRASICGYYDSSNSFITMDTSKSGGQLTGQEKEYLNEVNRTSIQSTVSSLSDYYAGEYIYYKIKKNEVVTVEITLTSEEAIIESGKKLYCLTKEKPGLRLIIAE